MVGEAIKIMAINRFPWRWTPLDFEDFVELFWQTAQLQRWRQRNKRVEEKDDVLKLIYLHIYRQRSEELLKLIKYLYILLQKSLPNSVKFGEFNIRIKLHDVSRDQVSKLRQVKTYQQKFIS